MDDWERNRNDIIYYDFQNNRNPFIDHPEYVGLIWDYNVGVLEEESSSNLKIYPNPNTGIVELQGVNGSYKVDVYDYTGKYLKSTSRSTIDLSDYPSGIYLLKVAYGDKTEEHRVVKE